MVDENNVLTRYLHDEKEDDETLLVSFHVKGQMVRSWETSVTVNTLEGFGTCVFPVVPRQFIRSCKPPLTTFPHTFVWLFSCKNKIQKSIRKSLGVFFVLVKKQNMKTVLDVIGFVAFFIIISLCQLYENIGKIKPIQTMQNLTCKPSSLHFN